jgi:LuxR family transcriptional regulator, glucitol operon activator
VAKPSRSGTGIITSRIGLGELEYRFPLQAMKSDDAVLLLRATAQARRVDQITRTNNSILKDYCAKMKNNSLFIKWFVSSVQAGKRPEEILLNSTLFLDYCLENVFNHVSEDARLLLKVMVSIPGPHSQAILSYLTQLSIDRLQAALQQLITANMLILVAQPKEAGYDSFYDLGELPRQYMLKTSSSLGR